MTQSMAGLLLFLSLAVPWVAAEPLAFKAEEIGEAFNSEVARLLRDGEIDTDVRVSPRGCAAQLAKGVSRCRYEDLDGQTILADGEESQPAERLQFQTAEQPESRRAFLEVAVRLLVPAFRDDDEGVEGYLDSVEALMERFGRAVSLLDGKEFIYFRPKTASAVSMVPWETNPVILSVREFKAATEQ